MARQSGPGTHADAIRALGPDWVADPATRGARNYRTGETISRRQIDKARIAAAGYGSGSFEAKAKARRAIGLAGFREGKFPGVYERTITDARSRKQVLRALPRGSRVRVLVYGDVDRGTSGKAGVGVWRTMNFPPAARGTAPVRADELVEVWDRWASRAQQSTDVRVYR
jgi:hypothetical protein